MQGDEITPASVLSTGVMMREIYNRINTLLSVTDKPVVIAIDGRAAAGKTTLARDISAVYDCNVFHMDDFFLPPSMRTPERLAEPGRNVHYERFFSDVLVPLRQGAAFSYGVFDCTAMAVTQSRQVTPKLLNVVEGSYSHHPFFGEVYDLRIFLTVSPQVQAERILLRNGAEKAKMFRERWIPMEERYFAYYGVPEKSDVVMG